MTNDMREQRAQQVLDAFNGGLVRVEDVDNPRGYTTRYMPLEAMKAALADQQHASAGEDWVLVPREPTEAMRDAGDDCYGVARGTESWVIGGCKGSEKIWSAMLSAAALTPNQTDLSDEGGSDGK